MLQKRKTGFAKDIRSDEGICNLLLSRKGEQIRSEAKASWTLWFQYVLLSSTLLL